MKNAAFKGFEQRFMVSVQRLLKAGAKPVILRRHPLAGRGRRA